MKAFKVQTKKHGPNKWTCSITIVATGWTNHFGGKTKKEAIERAKSIILGVYQYMDLKKKIKAWIAVKTCEGLGHQIMWQIDSTLVPGKEETLTSYCERCKSVLHKQTRIGM